MNATKLKKISDLMANGSFRFNPLHECSDAELDGKTFISITGAEEDSERIIFECDNGDVYIMYHEQDCCEDVRVCDVGGDISTILNRPVIFRSTTNDDQTSLNGARNAYDESYTWTFYHFRTIKGYVDIRWYGTSNGYYSERVDLIKISKEELNDQESDNVSKINLDVESLRNILKDLPDDMPVIIPVMDYVDVNQIEGFRCVRTAGILKCDYAEPNRVLCLASSSGGLDLTSLIGLPGKYKADGSIICDKLLF